MHCTSSLVIFQQIVNCECGNVVNGPPAVDKIDDETGLRKGIEDSFKTVEAMATAQNLDGIEQHQLIDCPITKVILFSIIGTVLTKTVKYDPTSSVIRNPPELFGESEIHNQHRFEKKCQKLISTYANINSFFSILEDWQSRFSWMEQTRQWSRVVLRQERSKW